MFGMESWFGHNKTPETGAGEAERTQEEAEGRTVEGAVDDISTSFEGIDYGTIKRALPEIYEFLREKYGLNVVEIQNYEKMFVDKLKEQEIIAEFPEGDRRNRIALDVAKQAIADFASEMAEADFKKHTKDQQPKGPAYEDVA